MAIVLSETAAREIKTIIKQQELPEAATKLRVGVKGGGCSGFSYMLDLTEESKGDSGRGNGIPGNQDSVRYEVVSVPQRNGDRFQG